MISGCRTSIGRGSTRSCVRPIGTSTMILEQNIEPVSEQVEHLKWAEAVVFIYPTWWYGLPAMLKGWLERVLVPGFAFPERGSVPKLKHITRVIVLTTCGATPFLSRGK